MSANMIEPRCLISGHRSTGSFPGDFAELGKWFRQPGSQTRHEAASRDRETPGADRIDRHCCTNEKRTSVLPSCCVEWFVALCNPLISLVWPCNVLQHAALEVRAGAFVAIAAGQLDSFPKTPPELTGRNAVARHSPCRFRMTDRRSETAGSRSPRAVCPQRELVHPA